MTTSSLGTSSLCAFHLRNRGLPQIEVTFDIDADSIIHVSATDKATNNDQSITISSGSGLSDSKIKSMLDDAEKYGEGDMARRAMIVGANRADSVANDTEKALKDFKHKLDKDEAENMKEKITALRDFSITAQQQTDAL
jgi:molecular chaperone DnaK